uniref:Uncharacterized protein n=1 Tax=Panagrolaimus superbus TaxID=310955 RepID=A0A914YVK9_9BILA
MNTLLRDNSILIQNAPGGFSDQSFNEISKVFKATTKQLLVSIGVCDNILFSKEGVQNHHEDRYRITLDAIAEIDEHLVNSDTKRKDEYWPEAVLNSSRTILTAMEKEDFGANRKIATTIMEKLKTDYPQWDEFFVGVYKNKLGYKFHSFYGESYELIKDYKGRNTFIFRRPKNHPYKKCDMSKVFNNHACILAKEDTGLLNTLAELLLDKCSEAKFIGVIQESMMLGVAMSNNDAGWFENFHPDCTELNNNGILVNRKHDLSVVVGW